MAAPDAAAILKRRCEAFTRSNKVLSQGQTELKQGLIFLYLWRSVTTNSLTNLMSDIATNRFLESRIGCVASLVVPAPAEYWKLGPARALAEYFE
jgi:hypothetical protein